VASAGHVRQLPAGLAQLLSLNNQTGVSQHHQHAWKAIHCNRMHRNAPYLIAAAARFFVLLKLKCVF
jgi:hypothetical protein